VRIARNDIGERKLPAHRDQQPGERYRVAATLAPVHADNDCLNIEVAPNLPFTYRVTAQPCAASSLAISLPSLIARRQWMPGLAALAAICAALMLSLVGGAA
jgi:hypothetical protein